MIQRLATAVIVAASCGGLMACAQSDTTRMPTTRPDNAEYLGVETLLIDSATVALLVQMRGARDRADVVAYARCAAAQYALIRGYSFAQHVRTNVTRSGDVWIGDGGFVISPDLPQGMRNMDAEVIVDDCREQGIPTV